MFPQQHHEFQDEQQQDHSERAPVTQTKAFDNKGGAPDNGYEFVLALLGWVEKNWIFILIALSILGGILFSFFGR